MTLSYLIDPDTTLGYVHYITSNLERQLDFYINSLGLKLHWREDRQAGLGTGRDDLLRISEVVGATRTPRTTGMYHFALLLPERKDLARVIARLFELQVPNYPTDHVISKTTYVDDPDGNNIEIYVYSLEDGSFSYQNGTFNARWADGRPSNGREPLDLDLLFSELDPQVDFFVPLPEFTKMGHVHLFGNNLKEQMRFYRDVLGFRDGGSGDLIGMAEVALDRPHVIAFNSWQGVNAQPPPENSLGIKYFSINFPNSNAMDDVLKRINDQEIPLIQTENGVFLRDPSGVRLHLGIKNNQT